MISRINPVSGTTVAAVLRTASSPMTAKIYLARKARNAHIAMACACLLLITTALLSRRLGLTGGWVEVALLLLFAAPLILLSRIRCPSCNGTLGSFAFSLDIHPGGNHDINFCPKCGVSFDRTIFLDQKHQPHFTS